MGESQNSSVVLLTPFSSDEINKAEPLQLHNERSRFPLWKKVAKKVSFKRISSLPSPALTKKRRIGIAGPSMETVSETLFKSSQDNLNEEIKQSEKQNGFLNKKTDKNLNQTIKISKSDKQNGNIAQLEDLKVNSNGYHSPLEVKINGFIHEENEPTDSSQTEICDAAKTKTVSSLLSQLQMSFQSCFSSKRDKQIAITNYSLSSKSTSQKFTHLGLLTPALIVHPAVHGKDAISTKLSQKLGSNLQLKLAAAHIKDAINGRGKFGEAKAIFKPPHIQKCFSIISSSWWGYLLYLIICVHCLMMIWEQPDTPVAIGQGWGSWGVHTAVLVTDAVCLLVYIVDIILHSLFLTWKNVWLAKETVWIRVEFVFTIFFIIDFIILLVENFISTRLLCPFRCLRSSMLLCKSKNVSHIFNVLLSIISKLGKVFLIIGIFIIAFSSIGLHLFMEDYHQLNQTCGNNTLSWVCPNIYSGAFDQVAAAALHMFVLMSTENYPEFIIPAFRNSWSTFFYFGIYLYAGVFFLTAILLAIIVESYWDYSKRHVKQERKQQREELAKAWNLMDPLGKGQLYVDDDQLIKLFHILKPKAKAASVAILLLIFIHSILFCLMWVNITEVTQLAIQSTKTAIVAVFVLEVIIRVIANGREILNMFDILDMSMVLFAAVADIAWYVLWYQDTPHVAIDLGACVVVSNLAILLRAVFNSQHARSAVFVLQNIYPVMFDLVLLVMTIIFNFAVIGMEIFQDKTLEHSQSQGYEGSYVEYGCGVGFNTFGCSLLIVFQIVTTNDWHEIMLGAMLDAGWPSAFYFVACYLIVDMIVMNLFVAISIEAYKKLAIDKTNLLNNAGDNPDNSDDESDDKENASFTTQAKNTINGIFASSRKSRASISSNTLTGYSASPYAVRRGTLGSLGFRTPTPTPRSDGSRRPSNVSNLSRPIVKVQDVDASSSADKGEEKPGGEKENRHQRNMDRRQMALKERQNQRKKERRRTKQEEEAKVANELKEETQLQIDGVVRLKRAVRVIKSYQARNSREMNVKEGEMVEISEKAEDMLHGPKGWFPAAYVARDSNKVQEETNHDAPHDHTHPHVIVTNEQEPRKTSRVQFDESIPEQSTKKPRQSSPRHRTSQTRMKRRGADWRRDIHGDITVMNKDEMQDLSKMIRGGLERRHTPHLRSVPSQLALRVTEELLEEDEEEEMSVPQLTVSEAKPEPDVQENNHTIVSDTNTLTLSVPQSRPPRRLPSKKSKSSGDGSIPDWMQKFVEEKQIGVDRDVKLEDSYTSTASSEEDREAKAAKNVPQRKRSIKRKNPTPPIFRKSSRPSPSVTKKTPRSLKNPS